MSNQTIRAPMACTVVEVTVAAGQAVQAGQTLLVLEAMKMEHELRAERDGQVLRVDMRAGELVAEGAVLMVLGATVSSVSVDVTVATPQQPFITPALRADLREVIARHAFTLDGQRPEAVAKRHASGKRTARENLADLCDAGSFIEYGALAVAPSARAAARPT